MLKKAGIGLAALVLAAGLATAASAHMWGGGHHDRRDFDTRSGWYCGMSHSGYSWDDPAWRTSSWGDHFRDRVGDPDDIPGDCYGRSSFE
jgi:hypothetical protein